MGIFDSKTLSTDEYVGYRGEGKICFGTPSVTAESQSLFALPFFIIYCIGMTITWFTEMYATGRQAFKLKDLENVEWIK